MSKKENPTTTESAVSDDKSNLDKSKTDTKDENKKASSSAKPNSKNQKTPSQKSGNKQTIGWLALIIGIGSAFASFQVSELLNQTKEALSEQINGLESDSKTAVSSIEGLNTKLDTVKQDVKKTLSDELNKEIESLAQVKKRQSLIQETLGKLKLQASNKKDKSWILAEADYLLRIANSRLHLERDINTSIATLESVDARLRDLADPALIEVRRLLSNEITLLKAIDQPDTDGIGLKLISLQQDLGKLPLKQPNYNKIIIPDVMDGEPANKFEKILSGIWNAIKDLVKIRKIDENDTPLLPPEQRAYLASNLELKLEAARLALLRNSETQYHASIKLARKWVKKYYLEDKAPTKAMLDALQTLDATKIKPHLPQITGSIDALHTVIRKKIKDSVSNKQSALPKVTHSGASA